MSGEIEWRWADPHGQQRLVRIDELRAALAGGVIAPNTPVWRSGWPTWKPAYEVPELTASAAANGAVLNIPPPPLFIVAAQHEYEDKGASHEAPASHTEPPPPPHYVPAAAPPVKAPSHPPVPTIEVSPSRAPEASPQVSSTPAPSPAAPSAAAAHPVVLFPAVPSPSPTPEPARAKAQDLAPPPVKPSISTARLKAVIPQPPTLAGLADVGSPPSSQPHSAKEPGRPVQPSVVPPADSGWDVGSVPPPAIPLPGPSETLAGARPPPLQGIEANTAVDLAKLSPADAERILVGGPSHPTVHGVPVMAQPALPPPPPFRQQSSVPPTLLQAGAQAGAKILTPAFGSVTGPPSAAPPPMRTRSTRPPPPLRKRGQTLMLYGGAPREADTAAEEAQSVEPAPINVPAPGAQAPKAVTQAPPWTGDVAKLAPTIPRYPSSTLPPIRPMLDSIEEISASVILAEDSGADVTAKRQKIEDLSGSHVLPDASGSAPQLAGAALAAAIGDPARTLHAEPAPPAHSIFSNPEPPTLPAAGAQLPDATDEDPLLEPPVPLVPPSPSRRIVHDLNLVWGQPRKRLMLAGAVGGSLVVLLGLIGLMVRLFGGPSSSEGLVATAAPVVTPATAPPVPGGGTAAVPTAAPESATSIVPAGIAPPSTTPCSVAGSAHVVAPKAQVRTGVETAASQNRLALGFATAEKDGLAVVLDPGSLAAVATARQRSREPIRRLVPQLGAGKSVTAVADTDRKGERIVGARTLSDGAFVLGSAEGKLVWAARANESPHPLWGLESDGPVESLRAVAFDEGGWAVAFRQGAAIYLGTLGADKVPIGGLSRIAGLGQQIGSPALGASGATAMVAWADRASNADPWMLRVTRWHPGQAPGEAQAFSIPPGGLGEQAMSPGLTGAVGGRFLLAWTEGPVASHQVRAQTFASSGEALGPPMTISGEGVNAGQGQPAILPDGRGLVVYMAAPTGATAQVVATPVACPQSSP